MLFPNSNIDPNALASIQSNDLEYLSLCFYKNNHNLNFEPAQYMIGLSEGNGKKLLYLKV